ncbi:MAG: GNAT family N-acetyltransferase [Reinekea sp.]
MTDTSNWLSQWPENHQPPTDNPFLSSGFLSTLEQTGICTAKTGWQPMHLYNEAQILIPTYVKSHSWGEYVFDWSWANAYEQHGFEYYPKLVVAVPYTPSQGPRFLGAQSEEDIKPVIKQLKQKTQQLTASGFHILFPSPQECQWLDNMDLLKRCDVQYHWNNDQYRDFDDYLDRFSSRKRKNVRKERASIAEQGLKIRRLSGSDIDRQSWHAFYQFYHATYMKRGRQGYLNREFFYRLLDLMKDQILLVMTYFQEKPVAASLFFSDSKALYGRYWGCFEEFNNLHFESCYYQGIEFCIEQGLDRFDPGTQGEHKISRGFEPTMTYSYHWLSNPQFFEAAKHFCEQELQMNQHYLAEARSALPFKTC